MSCNRREQCTGNSAQSATGGDGRMEDLFKEKGAEGHFFLKHTSELPSNLAYEKTNLGLRCSAGCRICISCRRSFQRRDRHPGGASRSGRAAPGVRSRPRIYSRASAGLSIAAAGLHSRTAAGTLRAPTSRGLCAASGSPGTAAYPLFRIW